jgi:two-component system, OmpR family, sensor kinase
MSRLPIRVRLTLPFAALIALVLAVTGYFIYARVGNALLASVDQSLRTQAAEIAGPAERATGTPDRDRADTPQVSQRLTAAGTVVESTPRGLKPILAGGRLEKVVAGRRSWTSGPISGLDNDWRALAFPARLDGRPGAVVIARSLEPREEALNRLIREFSIGGPVALLIATLAAYAVAAAALRPVEAMRRRAASITASTPGQLPVPPAKDELARLAVTLNDMLSRLEAAREHERRFVDDASHELRTPLAVLKAELELALRRPRSREELEQALASAAADTDELVRLAEDLLLVARSDQGRLPIRRERLSAREVLEDVAERFAASASERGRSIEVAGADAVIEADPARLRQALDNLVQNALIHGDGAIALAVVLSPYEVELHVLDAGPGVPQGFGQRAFERFSRADPARTSSGAGLGLAIVDVIARGHDGRAELRDRTGGGTDAVLVLPRGTGVLEPRPKRRLPVSTKT